MKKIQLSNKEVSSLFREKFVNRFIFNSNIRYLFLCEDGFKEAGRHSPGYVSLVSNVDNEHYLIILADALMGRVKELNCKKENIENLEMVLRSLINETRD